MSTCNTEGRDENVIFLKVDGLWRRYKGTTSLRKLYYSAYSAKKNNSSRIYVYEYKDQDVTGAMFPNYFYKDLSCVSIDGTPVHMLPHRILLKERACKVITLGDGSGFICTHCGRKV